MTDENARIHWLRIEKPVVLSQLFKKDGHNIAWKVQRTGRIGLRFRTDKGIASIELYEEFSYSIDTSLPKLKILQMHVEDAREAKLIGTLTPGLNPNCSEQEKLVREIAEIAADNHITNDGAGNLLWRFLIWAVGNDRSIMYKLEVNYPKWFEDAKQFITKEKS